MAISRKIVHCKKWIGKIHKSFEVITFRKKDVREMKARGTEFEILCSLKLIYWLTAFSWYQNRADRLSVVATGLWQRKNRLIFISLRRYVVFHQVYEMNKAGWTFHVLSPLYLIHWGFQESNQQPAYRKTQIQENSKKYNQFNKEIGAKYST